MNGFCRRTAGRSIAFDSKVSYPQLSDWINPGYVVDEIVSLMRSIVRRALIRPIIVIRAVGTGPLDKSTGGELQDERSSRIELLQHAYDTRPSG